MSYNISQISSNKIDFETKTPTTFSSISPSSPLHLDYMSGPLGDLFRELIERGVLDNYGNLNSEYAAKVLPSLTTSEINQIREILNKPITIILDKENSFTISIHWLLKTLQASNNIENNCYRFQNPVLIGGFVTSFLFSKTNYLERVFTNLKLADIYDKYKDYWHQPNKAPDIDIRIKVSGFVNSEIGLFPLQFQNSDLDNVTQSILFLLSYEFIRQTREKNKIDPFPRVEAQEKIKNQAFSEFCSIKTGMNLMQLLSFKDSPIDLNFFFRLSREFVFTSDDLYLPLNDILNETGYPFIFPQSNRKKTLQSLFDCLLGFINTEDPHTIDNKGFFRYFSGITKGNCCTFQDEKISLKDTLYSKIKYNLDNLQAFSNDIRKWIATHHPDNPTAAIFLTLNICLYLRNQNVSQEKIYAIIKNVFEKQEPLDPLSRELKNLLCHKGIPLKYIEDVLKISAFSHFTQEISSDASIRTEGFTHPVLYYKIKGYALQFDLSIQETLRNLLSLPKEYERDLAHLYFLISPPQAKTQIFDKEKLSSLNLDLETLREIGYLLIENESPFIQYLGFANLYSDPDLDKEIKKGFAERLLLSALTLSENKSEMLQEFGPFIGPLPKYDENFTFNWIKTLFEYGRNSEKNAYGLWTKHQFWPQSFELISYLAYSQPGYALKICLNMPADKYHQEAFECILKCGSVISKISNPSQEHLNFADHLQSKLQNLLNKESFGKSPQVSKRLSWFALRDESRELARLGLLKGLFLGQDQKACERLRNQIILKDSFQNLSINFQLAIAKLKESLNELTHEEFIGYMDKISETKPSYYDKTLFSQLLSIVCSSSNSFTKENNGKILRMITESLENQKNSLLKGKIKEDLEKSLALLSPYINFDISKQLFIQVIDKNIKLPHSIDTIWYQSIENLLSLENCNREINLLLKEGIRRGYHYENKKLGMLKLQIAEKFKNDPGFSNQSIEIMKNLVDYFPNEINQKKFYDLLFTLIQVNEEKIKDLLEIVDLVFKKERSNCYTYTLDRLTFLYFKNEINKNLISWLVNTHYFNDLNTRESFRLTLHHVLEKLFEDKTTKNPIVEKLVIKYLDDFLCLNMPIPKWKNILLNLQSNKDLVIQIIKKLEIENLDFSIIISETLLELIKQEKLTKDEKRNSLICEITYHYFHCFRDLNFDEWDSILNIVEEKDLDKYHDLFENIKINSNISAEVIFNIYASLFRVLTINKDPRIIEYLLDKNKFEEYLFYSKFSTNKPINSLYAHSYLMNSAMHRFDECVKSPIFFKQITRLHQLAKEQLLDVRASFDDELEKMISPESWISNLKDIESLEAVYDFSYLTILYKFMEISNDSEKLNYINTIKNVINLITTETEHKYPKEYWSKCGKLINLFLEEDSLKEETQLLLENLAESEILFLDTFKALSFLLKDESKIKDNCQLAAYLLVYIFLSNDTIEHTISNWELLYKTYINYIKYYPENQKIINKIIEFISIQKGGFLNKCGEIINMHVLEMVIRYWIIVLNPENASQDNNLYQLDQLIYTSLVQVHKNYETIKETKILITAVQDGIVHLSNLELHSFEKRLDFYLNFFTSNNNHKPTQLFINSEQECLEIKNELILKLISKLTINHRFPKSLIFKLHSIVNKDFPLLKNNLYFSVENLIYSYIEKINIEVLQRDRYVELAEDLLKLIKERFPDKKNEIQKIHIQFLEANLAIIEKLIDQLNMEYPFKEELIKKLQMRLNKFLTSENYKNERHKIKPILAKFIMAQSKLNNKKQ